MLVESGTGGALSLSERQRGAMNGRFGLQVLVPPGSTLTLAATTFRSRNRHCGRSSKILLFINGIEYQDTLTPDTFVNYVKLIFQFDAFNLLRVYGVPATSFDHICRLCAFGFLRGNYSGRQTELICKSFALRG